MHVDRGGVGWPAAPVVDPNSDPRLVSAFWDFVLRGGDPLQNPRRVDRVMISRGVHWRCALKLTMGLGGARASARAGCIEFMSPARLVSEASPSRAWR